MSTYESFGTELWTFSLTAQAELLENAQHVYSRPHGSREIKKNKSGKFFFKNAVSACPSGQFLGVQQAQTLKYGVYSNEWKATNQVFPLMHY